MMHVVALLFAFGALTGLCAAMSKHQNDLLGRRLSARNQRVLRLGALAAMAAAYAGAVAASGWKFGSVEWVGTIILAALGLTLLIPYRPGWAAPAGAAAMIFGTLIGVAATLIAFV